MARGRKASGRNQRARRGVSQRASTPRRTRSRASVRRTGASRAGRSRRRISSRSRAWMLVPLLILVLGAGVGALVTQWDRLPFDSLQQSRSSSDPGRFKGLDGITIESGDTSMYWWLMTTMEESVNASDLPPEFSSQVADALIQRTVLPAGITFRADSSELSAEALDSINAAATVIPETFIKITVFCHSSADGTKESRLPLSQKRADVLAAELETILALQLGTIERMGLGDEYPVAGIDPESPTGRLVNRRCEILVES